MEALYEVLPIVIYMLIAILLVVLIILGIKLIDTANKTNAVLDDIEQKSKTLDGLFGTVDRITDAFTIVSDKVIDGIAGLIGKAFSFKKKKKEEEEEDYE